MNQFRTYEFDPRILMCSIEAEEVNPENVSFYNQLFESFLENFKSDKSFATVTPFGIHFRITINSKDDAFSIPRAFDDWLFDNYQYASTREGLPCDVPTVTDFSVTPTSLIDPEGYKKRVQAVLDEQYKKEEE